jgi:quercetin dioxygenase-like cupin family protein
VYRRCVSTKKVIFSIGALAMSQSQRSSNNTTSSIEPQEQAENVALFDLHALTHFKDDGPSVQVISDSRAARLVLFAFEAGQQLKEHHTSSQILLQVLRGYVEVTTPGKSVQLQTSMVLQIAANVLHSVTAPTDAVMLLTLTPSPAHHSLQEDVFKQHPPLVVSPVRSRGRRGVQCRPEIDR